MKKINIKKMMELQVLDVSIETIIKQQNERKSNTSQQTTNFSNHQNLGIQHIFVK